MTTLLRNYRTDEGPKEYIILVRDQSWCVMKCLCSPSQRADSLTVVVAAKNTEDVEVHAMGTVSMIKTWLEKADLTLRNEEMEVVLITNWGVEEKVGGHTVVAESTNKYQWVIIDIKLSFRGH